MSGLEWSVLQDKIDVLPESLKDLLISIKTAGILENISTNRNLGPEQQVVFSVIIREIVMANTYIGTFISTLEDRLKISRDQAREIANTAVEQLFKPVLGDIKDLQRQRFGNLMPPSSTSGAMPREVPGADLPETGGNIINLRENK